MRMWIRIYIRILPIAHPQIRTSTFYQNPIMAISVGDEFETCESLSIKLKKFPLIQIVTNLRISNISNFAE